MSDKTLTPSAARDLFRLPASPPTCLYLLFQLSGDPSMLFSTRLSPLSFTVAALLAGGLIACNRRDSSDRTGTATDDKALAESAAV